MSHETLSEQPNYLTECQIQLSAIDVFILTNQPESRAVLCVVPCPICHTWGDMREWRKKWVCHGRVRVSEATRDITSYVCVNQDFTDDLRHRLRGAWRAVEGVDPRTTNNKQATLSSILCMHNVSRFRLRAHTLTVETASWEDGISPGLCALRQKYSKLWTLSGDYSLAHPFLQHQLSVQAVSNFLLQRNKKLFYFMSEILLNAFATNCYRLYAISLYAGDRIYSGSLGDVAT
eukprot:1138512-Pelagomonas_calceolata.AAC.1